MTNLSYFLGRTLFSIIQNEIKYTIKMKRFTYHKPTIYDFPKAAWCRGKRMGVVQRSRLQKIGHF